jgi:uracil-DNA glycosylase family 4
MRATLGAHCDEKIVPKFMFQAPLEVRKAFLLGWYSTDGNHLKDLNRNRKIATTSLQGARDLFALFLSCHVYPTFRVEYPSPKSKGKLPCYTVGIRNADVLQLGWPIETHTKKPRAIHTVSEKGVFVPINKVRVKRWRGKVYNIETATHDYLTPFRVHNSTELMQGYPFCGESGGVLNKAFKQAGIDRGYVWITNALLCQRPNQDEDLEVAVDACRPRLKADLERAQPTCICALGGTAMRALQLPVCFVSQARGTVQYTPLLPGVPVIGTIHPAALLRGGAGEMAGGGKQKMNVDAQAMFLFSDVAKAYRVSTGEISPTWSDDILVVHQPSEVKAALWGILEDIYEWGMLGIDLEWTCEGSKNPLDALGADAHRAQITWVGIGCAKRAVSFKFEALVESGELPQLQACMEDPDLMKLAHNKQADRAIWEGIVGPVYGRWIDTLLLHHAAYPGIDHDLQQVVSQQLCVPPWKVDHARQIAEYKAKEKAEMQAAKVAEKEAKKAARVAEHEAKNAKAAADKAARQAQKQADHEARNAQLHADKEARKAAKKGKKGAPDVLPGQLSLSLTSDDGPSMADELVDDMADAGFDDLMYPGPEPEDGY